MIINNTQEEVKGSVTELETNSFTISNSPHMIEILSKKLYRNPEAAVVRELVCNALDAHVLAGSKEKVQVTLPSLMNDYNFVVKDFGTGLSDEDVMQLYTTYGRSTKQNSNDFVGCLGIGSKSPFALTDEFTVVSRYKGTATTYHCYKQKGMPVCTRISQVPCDDSGMTITVPLDFRMATSFTAAASRIFNGFSENSVTVSGAEKPTMFWEDLKRRFIPLAKDSYTYYYAEYHDDRIPYEYRGNRYVKMGSVLYECPTEWFARRWSYMNDVVILEVPIGTFEISASREALEVNDNNKNVCHQIETEIFTKHTKEIEESVITKAKSYVPLKELARLSNLPFYPNIELSIKEKLDELGISHSFSFSKAYDKSKYNKTFRACSYCQDSISNLDSLDIAIVEDCETSVPILTLIKRYYRKLDTSAKFYVWNRKPKQIPFTSIKFIYLSQLVKDYEQFKLQQKRSKKSSKKAGGVKDVEFKTAHFYSYQTLNNKNASEEFAYVPYTFSKECIEDISMVHEALNKYVYRVPKHAMKNLSPFAVPLEEYIKRHSQEIDDYYARRSEEEIKRSLNNFTHRGVHSSEYVNIIAELAGVKRHPYAVTSGRYCLSQEYSIKRPTKCWHRFFNAWLESPKRLAASATYAQLDSILIDYKSKSDIDEDLYKELRRLIERVYRKNLKSFAGSSEDVVETTGTEGEN